MNVGKAVDDGIRAEYEEISAALAKARSEVTRLELDRLRVERIAWGAGISVTGGTADGLLPSGKPPEIEGNA